LETASIEPEDFLTVLKAVPSVPGQAQRDWRVVPRGKDVPLLDFSSFETLPSDQRPATSQFLFRLKRLPGVTEGDRVLFRGQHYVVQSVTEALRGTQMEVRCETLADYASRLIRNLR
jgi:hypothetical protein